MRRWKHTVIIHVWKDFEKLGRITKSSNERIQRAKKMTCWKTFKDLYLFTVWWKKLNKERKKKQNKMKKRLRSVSSTTELPSLKVLEWVLKLPKKDRTRTREKSWYWQIETIWKVKKQLYKDDNYWGKLSSDVGMDQ